MKWKRLFHSLIIFGSGIVFAANVPSNPGYIQEPSAAVIAVLLAVVSGIYVLTDAEN